MAYEAELFQRSARLLSRLALLEKPDINDASSARATLNSLFRLILSGTHASARTRATIVDELINSTAQEAQNLGIYLLEAALVTHGFWTSYTSTFGARPRDFGYYPTTNQEIVDWYKLHLSICTRTALLDAPIAREAKRVLANQLGGLWWVGLEYDQAFLDDLEHSVSQIHNQNTWNEGWISVREIIQYGGQRMDQHALSRLKQLSRCLEPVNLLERARAYVLTDKYLGIDLEDGSDEEENTSDGWQRVQQTTRQIGAAVAQDLAVFRELLPELVSGYHPRLGVFGEGLADGCEDRKSMWQTFYEQIEKTPPEKRQIAVVLGFLSACAARDPEFYHSILDSLVKDELLGEWFPYFQVTSTIDKQGIERLHKALDEGTADANGFRQLAWGRRHVAIGDDDLAALAQKVLEKEGGVRIVLEILSMRFHGENDTPAQHSRNLLAVSREVLLKYPYEDRQNVSEHPDYELTKIADVSLRGQEGAQSAKELCQRLREGFRDYRIYHFDYPRLLSKLALVHPHVFLDAFVRQDSYRFGWMARDDFERAGSPVNQIPEDVIIDWCEQDPGIRYSLIVSSMQMYLKERDSEELCWYPILSTILEKTPDLQAVLLQLEKGISPMSWSGSHADAMAKRLKLFAQLSDHSNPEIRDWAIGQHQKLQLAVQVERQLELRKNQDRFETFE